MTKSEIGKHGAYSYTGEMRDAYKILIGETERRGPHEIELDMHERILLMLLYVMNKWIMGNQPVHV
jgi:hypothetical protein